MYLTVIYNEIYDYNLIFNDKVIEFLSGAHSSLPEL